MFLLQSFARCIKKCQYVVYTYVAVCTHQLTHEELLEDLCQQIGMVFEMYSFFSIVCNF